MLAYHFDPVTRLFSGESTADRSPLEPGVWLFPQNTTEVPPPSPVAGIACIWDAANNLWREVEDLRGRLIYDIETRLSKTVTEVGPVPEGYTLDKPPSAYHRYFGSVGWTYRHDLALEDVLRKISVYRDELEKEGFNYAGYWWHNDPISLAKYHSLASMALSIATLDKEATLQTILRDDEGQPIEWKTMGEERIELTLDLVGGLLSASLLHSNQLHQAAVRHKELASYEDHPEDYDYSTGWPDTYLTRA